MSAFKAVLLGESGVGKSTLSNMLRKQVLNGPRKPTIGVNIEKVPMNNGNMCLWDLAGQRRFHFMWDEFLKGSGLTIVVTDSTPKNVMLTKDIIERHTNSNASKIIAIANKQDLDGRMPPDAVQAALGIPTYGMVGINPKNDQILREIIGHHVEQ